MTKAELRRQFLTLRKSLSVQEVEARSRQIAQRFFEQRLVASINIIHSFLPILRHNEVNTWPIIHQFWHDYPNVRIAVSVTDTEAYKLAHYSLDTNTALVENRWGIPEPIAEGAVQIETSTIDLVLVPLLVFDQGGHRVGYGGGFYDRFLADCRPDCQKIGLSLFEPIDQIDDVEPTDVSLDACITPDHMFYFPKE